MTATDRGADRLAEQGALAYLWLADGPMPAIRQAEQQVSAAGLAPQRRSRSTKVEAWWSLPGLEARALELAAGHARIMAAMDWPDQVELRDNTPEDNVARFGLADLPGTYHEVTDVAEAAALVGIVLAAVGRELLVDTASSGPVLTDTRLLAGRTCFPCNDPDMADGLTLQPRNRPRSTHAAQDVLF